VGQHGLKLQAQAGGMLSAVDRRPLALLGLFGNILHGACVFRICYGANLAVTACELSTFVGLSMAVSPITGPQLHGVARAASRQSQLLLWSLWPTAETVRVQAPDDQLVLTALHQSCTKCSWALRMLLEGKNISDVGVTWMCEHLEWGQEQMRDFSSSRLAVLVCRVLRIVIVTFVSTVMVSAALACCGMNLAVATIVLDAVVGLSMAVSPIIG
jgi:hypothetical protein